MLLSWDGMGQWERERVVFGVIIFFFVRRYQWRRQETVTVMEEVELKEEKQRD